MAGDEGAGERADRDHGPTLLADLVQHGGDQVAAQAPPAEPRVGLGVDEGELAIGAAVLDEATQFPVGLDFVAGPLGMIFDLLSHDSCSRQLTHVPALPGIGELSYRYGVSHGQTGGFTPMDAVIGNS